MSNFKYPKPGETCINKSVLKYNNNNLCLNPHYCANKKAGDETFRKSFLLDVPHALKAHGVCENKQVKAFDMSGLFSEPQVDRKHAWAGGNGKGDPSDMHFETFFMIHEKTHSAILDK